MHVFSSLKRQLLATGGALVVLFFNLSGVPSVDANETGVAWAPAGDKIRSPWAAKVTPNVPLPEYPRPQLTRPQWFNLNGLWDYALTPLGVPVTDKTGQEPAAPRPFGGASAVGSPESWLKAAPAIFAGKILVPFAIESSLSGVGKRVDENNLLWYKREFAVPSSWAGQKIVLNFGAVDWHAEVWVNGKHVGGHKGGYTPFSFDITKTLNADGKNTLLVRVYDGTDRGNRYQPVGKQLTNARSIWYTPVTGIWQTVWLEPVPMENHITSVRAESDIDASALYIDVDAARNNRRTRVRFNVLDHTGKIVVSGHGKLNNRIKVIVDNPVLWSPENPYLYDVDVTLSENGKEQETVRAYVAFRKIAAAKDRDGFTRFQLNNKVIFQFGPLDQGWWPDGLYTAPTDEALLFDIKKTKQWGFNMIRKHVKVEPARWYYHCDKEGILVWQDMPSGNWPPEWGRAHYDVKQMTMNNGKDTARTKESKENFRREWKEIIDLCRVHPSVVVWVPFNESWGQFDTSEITTWTKRYDPTRLVNPASGGNFRECADGDIHDWHNYPTPVIKFLLKDKINVLGEYGGIGFSVKGHVWREGRGWGYIGASDKVKLTTRYIDFAKQLKTLVPKGVSAAVYTQTTDVELEVNGIMTYDRKEVKMDEKKIADVNREVISALAGRDPEWQPVGLRLKTPWTDKVDPKNPLPEYPRPTLQRDTWKNLNGLWQYDITPNPVADKERAAVVSSFLNEKLKNYVTRFNSEDNELYKQAIPNSAALDFLSKNAPLLDYPDADIERTYYFRWWTFRKHIKQTPDGFVVTEFLPKVSWAGKHNTISCAAGYHFREGRWLRDSSFLDDYAVFWLRKGGAVRSYSFWIADSILQKAKITGDYTLAKELLPDLIKNYEAWEKGRFDPNNLYWQHDGADGGEMSAAGNFLKTTAHYRASLNAYQFADAQAIAVIAGLAGKNDIAKTFSEKAKVIRNNLNNNLWNNELQFYTVAFRGKKPQDKINLVNIREQHGFTPWFFENFQPPAERAVAFKQLLDPKGFYAPYGPTTCEQRSPHFGVSYKGHECQWNGPSWPFATSMTLTAVANEANRNPAASELRDIFYKTFDSYTKSHALKKEDGRVVPWIDENINPATGEWLARARLKTWQNGTWSRGKGGVERGKDYNHSTYCDLVLSGLLGIRPVNGDEIVIFPLVPRKIPFFAVENLNIGGKKVDVFYDGNGNRYKRGGGLQVFVDGKQVYHDGLPEKPVYVKLGSVRKATTAATVAKTANAGSKVNTTAAIVADPAWKKFEKNPVLGNKRLGTCFDLAMLREDGRYKMWFSWRPKESVAYSESKDGENWTEPKIVIAPRKTKEGWENRINRPGIVKKDGVYHLWYTGQNARKSWIFYATSADGLNWKRMSDKPVLTAAEKWEKVAVMCPHVEWDADAGVFKMWYSGGDQYEPNAVGYATSADGINWKKHAGNPIFTPDKKTPWEQHKVTACQLVKHDGWWYMFYIGFENEHRARIGLARSKDGITNWQRHANNPIVTNGAVGEWDFSAVYKPFAIYTPEDDKWRLWFNGRNGAPEYIGMAIKKGRDLGFVESKIVDETPEKETGPQFSADKKILVPFPLESPLSSVRKFLTKDQYLWYKKEFSVPAGAAWKDKKIMLNFGAVDWQADVWVNDKYVGQHKGGYTPFSFDITPFLNAAAGANNTLVVRVFDPTEFGIGSRGKQVSRPDGIFYTPASGIWQTVWIEPVPAVNHLTGVRGESDIDNETLAVIVDAVQKPAYARIDIRLSDAGGNTVAEAKKVPLIGDNRLRVKNPKLWSPDSPHLYNLEVTLYPDGKTAVETVKSYTAFRKISTKRDADGVVRLQLNNKTLFQFGMLDQGFWPDGIYTAPTDEALAFDVKQTKALGFNMLRKHIKVEPVRWYYHCDKEGVLVWQDMPSGGDIGNGRLDMRGNVAAGRDCDRVPESRAQYKQEWKEIIDLCRAHPSVVVWVPFNESWGQFDTVEIATWTKQYDPSRLVNAASGGNHFNTGDFYDHHAYPAPSTTKHGDPNRVIAIGEFGGLGWREDNHLWERGKGWGWGQPNRSDPNAFVNTYVNYAEILVRLARRNVSAAVYTQITDVETEANGLITYDRQKVKIDPVKTKQANQKVIAVGSAK
ncbi:MAG: hypothetical protein LBS59_04880 [Puniceicoccales bacterium]|jgi:beta-galactosidase/beta-glucuronidase|nr:hypothetical protein [Puniceicoccales bacterium]